MQRSSRAAGLGRGGGTAMSPSAGYTPLHVAILRKDVELVQLLLRAGADSNKAVSTERGGQGALRGRWPSCAPHPDFLPFSAPPKEPSCGRSPLHLAVEAQSLEMAELLLRAGADPAARGYGGRTPLYSARLRPDPRLPQLLRAFGAPESSGDSEDSEEDEDSEEEDSSGVSSPQSPT